MTNHKTEHILTMESITAAQVEYTYCQKLGYPTSKHCDAFNWPRLFDDGFVETSTHWPFVLDVSGTVRDVLIKYSASKNWKLDIILPHEILNLNIFMRRLFDAQENGTILIIYDVAGMEITSAFQCICRMLKEPKCGKHHRLFRFYCFTSKEFNIAVKSMLAENSQVNLVKYDTTVSSGEKNGVRRRSFKTEIVWCNDETAPLSIKFLRLACANYKLKENEEAYLKMFGSICKGDAYKLLMDANAVHNINGRLSAQGQLREAKKLCLAHVENDHCIEVYDFASLPKSVELHSLCSTNDIKSHLANNALKCITLVDVIDENGGFEKTSTTLHHLQDWIMHQKRPRKYNYTELNQLNVTTNISFEESCILVFDTKAFFTKNSVKLNHGIAFINFIVTEVSRYNDIPDDFHIILVSSSDRSNKSFGSSFVYSALRYMPGEIVTAIQIF